MEHPSFFAAAPQRRMSKHGPLATDRIFFALLPRREATNHIVEAARSQIARHNLRTDLRALETLHVSVLGVGYHWKLSPDHLDVAVEAGDDVRATRFRLRFSDAMSFKNAAPYPFVLLADDGIEQVHALGLELATGMIRRGYGPAGKIGGLPHMTLFYDRALVPRVRLDRAIDMHVRDFALVRSHFNQGRYTVLKRWSLEW